MKIITVKLSQYQAGEIAKLMTTVSYGNGSDWHILKNDLLHASKLTDNVISIEPSKKEVEKE